MSRALSLLAPALVFLAVLVVQAHPKMIPASDTRWSIYTAVSLVRDGDVDLVEFPEAVANSGNMTIELIDGHYYNYFPIGVSLLALPFVAAFEAAPELSMTILPGFGRFSHPFYLRGHEGPPDAIAAYKELERAVAALAVAATAVFLYLLARRQLPVPSALVVVAIFALGTSAWSVGSRALWQHAPSMLTTTIALYLIVAARDKPALIQYAALPLAFGYMVRPTNAIPALLLTAYVFFEHRRYFIRFALCASLIAVPWIVANLVTYASPLPPYYTGGGRVGRNADFFEALFANLVSPARGLFVFSPVLVFAIAGFFQKRRDGSIVRLDYYLAGIVIAHWVLISSFTKWWAGHSYGPRFMSDLTPYFLYFLIPVLAGIPKLPVPRRAAIAALFTGAFMLSVFTHYRGAYSIEAQLWNRLPEDVDKHPERVWDWRDPQFLRGF